MDNIDLKPFAILSERVEGLLRGIVTLLPNLVAAILFLFATWLLARAIRWFLSSVVFRKRIRGVAYGENIAEAQKVIQGAVEIWSMQIQIFAQAFGASSIDFEVTWWTGSKPVDIRRSRDEVVEAVKSALDKAGIEIPFPYRTLTFKDPLEVAGLPERAKSGDEA